MKQDISTPAPLEESGRLLQMWHRLTGNGTGRSRVLKWSLAIILTAGFIAISVSLHSAVKPGEFAGPALDIPREWDKGWDVIKVIDKGVDWLVIEGDAFFGAIHAVVIGMLRPFRNFLLWLPWWLVMLVVGLISWRAVGFWFGALTVAFFVYYIFMGLYDLSMMTLAIVLTSTVLCVVVGVPIGIFAGKSDRFENTIRPILDMMQTLPSFVYLIPALMLFGLGMVPAVMATCIYAIPPIIRLTSLGIRQVDARVVEAARSFGTTTWQLLTRVQIPLAMPTIMAGLNQTVMMALAMVVLASMIGASGLGVEVLNGIARVEPGRGFIAGIAIVFMAIVLDRVSQAFARRQPGLAPVRAG